MKKLVVIACIFLSARAYAQNEGLPKLLGGAILAVSGATDFTNREKPFTLGYNFSPNILFVTPHTFHNVMYGMAGNTVQSVNGYFLTPKRGTDAYIALRKSLASRSAYAGVGIEMLVNAEGVSFFLFAEAGTNISPNQKIATLGVHMNIEALLWKKK
jgi:hypothetical protein